MQNPTNGHVPGAATIMFTVPSEPPAAAPAPAPAEELPATTCACGHPQAQHDRIATRYCLATAASRLTRGCVCADTAAPQG
jgi:hypothetical protein